MDGSDIEQFQQKCAAVLRPELRQNKEIGAEAEKQKPGRCRAFAKDEGGGLMAWPVQQQVQRPEPAVPGCPLPVAEP